MERRFSVRLRISQCLAFVVLMSLSQLSVADVAVVLVTGKDSSIETVSSLDIRKAYLGISVTLDGQTVRPVRRRDDERLDEIFLQTVMAMSRRSYERRLLSLLLKFGTPRPEVVNDRANLQGALARKPSSITYMWKSDAEADPQVKIIRVLWQET
jgi:hypothetical protein